LTHYETLVGVHRDFIDAGAEVVITNTFATHRFVLAAAGLADRFDAIQKATVGAARAAASNAGGNVAIAGSMSCLPPGFDARNYPSPRDEEAAYRELAERLATLGVDLIALEMMQDQRHASLAFDAALATGLPVWLGLCCRFAADGRSLVTFDDSAVPFRESLRLLESREPAMVNIMHSPCAAIPAAMSELRAVWTGPVGVYPEVGSFDTATRSRTERIEPARLGLSSREWLAAGASLLGGCCGAGPEHVRAIRAVLESD
jgi:methionine synthase I (cobalamin-dependent)